MLFNLCYYSKVFFEDEFLPSSQSRSNRTLLLPLHFCKTEQKHIDTNHIPRYEPSLTDVKTRL